MRLSWRAMSVVVVCVCVLAGCSGWSDQPSGQGTHTPSNSGSPARIAGSLPELFQKALDTLPATQAEREVIQRAIVTGRIDSADYEAFHLGYVQCLEQHGFDPPFRKTPEGYYIELPFAPGDPDASTNAHDECIKQMAVIDVLYRAQQGNPELLADSRLQAVRCLQKYGYLGSDYTAEDFDRDKSADTFPFDKYEEQPNNCLYLAGYAYWRVGPMPSDAPR